MVLCEPFVLSVDIVAIWMRRIACLFVLREPVVLLTKMYQAMFRKIPWSDAPRVATRDANRYPKRSKGHYCTHLLYKETKFVQLGRVKTRNKKVPPPKSCDREPHRFLSLACILFTLAIMSRVLEWIKKHPYYSAAIAAGGVASYMWLLERTSVGAAGRPVSLSSRCSPHLYSSE